MARERYAGQVRLVVRALPVIAREPAFALKGGTAINLFYRDMPRLSVDIDLTWLPLEPFDAARANIDAAFERLRGELAKAIPGARVQRIAGGGGGDTRMLLSHGGSEVKVEVSPVARGTVHPPRRMTVTDAVEDEFGFAEMPVLAFEDLFAGKLHAALDRQHPRDLYDVKLLYDAEGFTPALFDTLLVYLAGSNRPFHELLDPNFLPLDQPFALEFEGMTVQPVSLEALASARERLVRDLWAHLDERAAQFLLSLYDREPDFSLIGLPQAEALPAIQWKLLNLGRLADRDPEKYAGQRELLLAAIAKARKATKG